jgi:hypothetical protein
VNTNSTASAAAASLSSTPAGEFMCCCRMQA